MPRWVGWIGCAGVALGCGAPQREIAPAPAPAAAPSPPPVMTPAPPEPVAAAPARRTFVPPTRSLLADGFLERFKQRARPQNHRPAADPVAVVAREPERERVVFDAASFRVLGWVAHLDLYEVSVDVVRVAGAPRGTPPPTGPGATLAAGVRLQRRAEKAGWVSIETVSDLRVHGWLPAAQIGYVFESKDLPAEVQKTDAELLSGSKVLWSPGGKTLALLPKDHVGPFPVEEVKSVGWFVEIRALSPELDVRGYVPKQQLKPYEPYGYGVGYGFSAGLVPPIEHLVFEPGTCLYDRPGGEVVGVVRAPLGIAVHVETGERAAWRELRLGAGIPFVHARRSAASEDRSKAFESGPPLAIPLESWQCDQPDA